MPSSLVKLAAIGLTLSGVVLGLLLFAWPYVVPTPPFPVVEAMVGEIRTQSYGAVWRRLSERWQREMPEREYVAANLRDDAVLIGQGGFIESTFLDSAATTWTGDEAFVPVYYRIKVVAVKPPRDYVRKVIFKLVYRRAVWHLDGMKVFNP